MAVLPFPDPPLRSDSIALRPWTAADIPAVVAACQDPLIARFAATVPSPYGEDDARKWLASLEPDRHAGVRLELAITDTSGGALGWIALSSFEETHRRAMVSYWVMPEARGQGIAPAAIRLLSEWAFDQLGLMRLEMFIEPDNVASLRTAERSGFRREGHLRSRWISKGRRRDSVVYGLLHDELP